MNALTKPTKMEGFTQTLKVSNWPLKYPGSSMRFPYVVAIGVFPDFDKGEGYFPYADFAAGSNYVRYRLPIDHDLIQGLFHMLKVNIDKAWHNRSIKEHILISRTSMGYHLELDMR